MFIELTVDGNKTNVSVEGRDTLVIGRSDSADLRVPAKTVSRSHAVLRKLGSAWFIEDSGSHSGTFVNDQRIEAITAVQQLDLIRIGPATLRFIANPEALASMTSKKAESAPAPVTATEPPPVAKPTVSKAVYKEQPKDENGKPRLPLYEPEGSNGDLFTPQVLQVMRKINDRILERMNISGEDAISGKEMAAKAEAMLDEVLRELQHIIPDSVPVPQLRQALLDSIVGFGPLSPLIRDKTISEIMINGPENVFVEQKGLIKRATTKFRDEAQLQVVIQRIVEPLGRHVDAASPMVDARLPDGSRVNAIIPPLALDGSDVTIRKFSDKKLGPEDLVKFGSMTNGMAEFLREAVRVRKNIVVSGGTGSGKTTLLNILSQFIPYGERVITVEDSAELKLDHENLCRLEARPANVEGKGRVSIRDLVINTLRMRPDRIVVGECRGAEALDMLQAMNTGHDGSLTTLHANTPRDALGRLENMVMMAGFDLPSSAIREQIASAIDLIVQQTRLPDGSRKVVKITEITGREGDIVTMQDIFSFDQEGFDENFKVVGKHNPTGNIPVFVDELRKSGDLRLDMGVFVPEG